MTPARGAGRLLIIRGGAVGDFILTMPALRLLREELPGNRIEILGYPAVAALALEWELADAVRPLEHGALAPFFVPGGQLDPEWCSHFASFHVVISYLFDPDRFFAGNLERAGVKTLLQGPHKPVAGGGPAALQLARPLESLALFLDRTSAARPFLTPVPDLERKIAVHPGSGGLRKNWPPDRWLEVCSHLARSGCRLLIVSGEAESEWISPWLAELRRAGVQADWQDQAPLPQLVRELQRCSFFLGHDSGIAHLAAAAGLPCLLLFGPTAPETWAPLQPGVRCVTAPAGDLTRLSVAEVVGAIEQNLGALRR